MTTVAMIQNVAESFSNGTVAVTEFPSRYRIEIKFVGSIGTPPNMDDLTAACGRSCPPIWRGTMCWCSTPGP